LLLTFIETAENSEFYMFCPKQQRKEIEKSGLQLKHESKDKCKQADNSILLLNNGCKID
jgi:hypothetical protein